MPTERFNWNSFYNQAVYGGPVYPWQGIEQRVTEAAKNAWSHPFATKVREGVTQATTAWWENVNPQNIRTKDTAWRIGLTVGLVESAAFTFLAPIPGSGIVKGAVNTALTQGAFFGARALHFSVEERIKSFAKGVSAGGLYFSLPSGIARELVGTVAESLIQAPSLPALPDITKAPGALRDAVGGFLVGTRDRVGGFINNFGNSIIGASSAARDTTVGAVNAVGRKIGLGVEPVPPADSGLVPPAVTRPDLPPAQPIPAQEVPQPEVVQSQLPTATPAAVEPAKPVFETAISKMEQNNEFMNSLAANVGEKLPIENEVIAKVLANKGQSIYDLSPQALQSARAAVQNALEKQVNFSGSEALQTIISESPDIDITSETAVNLAKEATKANFETWLASSIGQDKLMEAAQATLSQQTTILPVAGAKIAQFLTENQASSEIFTEHIVKPGETAGHLLLRMGADVRWDGTDWPLFAVLNMMNPDSFADLRTATGLSPIEFAELIKKFQNGDQQAYQTLIKYMGLIKAGRTITLLTPSGVQRLLARF